MLTCNHMVRTQIQLTETQAEALQKLAAARKQSMAQVIRMSVDLFVQKEAGVGSDARIERAKCAIGKFTSDSSDGSRLHDRHLADAFAAGK
jgi:hypothetical protein